MTRYTFEDALPLGGGSAALVTAAIEAPHAMSLSRLATRAGISRFAAQRAIERLRETEVLTWDGYGWEFNDDHPLASLLLKLAWTFSGAQRPDKSTDPYYKWHQHRWQDDYRYRGVLPPSLLHPEEHDPAATLEGPDLLTARALVLWADECVDELSEFEQDAQDVYAVWRTERLRDMVHQTLHLGGPTADAAAVLATASKCSLHASEKDIEVGTKADPRLQHVSALTWARATYLIAADLHDVRRIVTILNTAIDNTQRMHSQRADVLGSLETAARIGADSPHYQSAIDEAIKAAVESRALWDAPSKIPYRNIGGMPKPIDVGTTGDKIYTVRLVRVGTRLAEKIAEMASHPALDDWKTMHPDEAEEFPLCVQAPEAGETT